MNSRFAKIAAPLAGVALAGGAVVAGVAAPASAVQAPAPTAAASVRLAKPNKIVNANQIRQYQITPNQMTKIVKANRFAQTKKAKMIRNRESHGNYRIVSRSGSYAGAYQFDRRTWQTMGGKQFAPTANRAPAFAQDYIMWRTVQSHGWAPWGG